MSTPDLFKDLGEVLTITEAARALNLNRRTIADAVRRGEIPAFIIGNREPKKSGRGLGYRIKRDDLQRWYFGQLPAPVSK